jgi:ATP-dependent helicase Lhr and Lhr-like helicase
MDSPQSDNPLLPERFEHWFSARGWVLRNHQAAMLAEARQRRSALLIAPTGAGKTLAGFLPALVELADRKAGERDGARGLHTLYLSPLKALAVDISRNLEAPIAGMALPVRVEARTGDTPASRRQRQMRTPPDILLTTPEQLALILSHGEARRFFGDLRMIIVDELHALAPGKRGDLLALDLARLESLAPAAIRFGLSATVAEPDDLRRWLVPQVPAGSGALADLVEAPAALAARPDLSILETEERLPWAGHSARHAIREIYAEIDRHKLSLLFVNTRMQAEMVFQLLWAVNDAGYRIALHHGSLDIGQRRKVEAAMAAGKIDAVVCTSTLDLGIDWGDVDLVVNIGAPKGASRLLQRIGRANHRLDQPSKAILVPSNRFEVLECRAAIDAAYAGEQDAATSRVGALDVLAQHILGMCAAEPVHPDDLFAEVRTAAPYAALTRDDFDRVLGFVRDGGYALRAYERFAKVRPDTAGKLRIANARIAQSYRMNVGTIVESTMLKVHLGSAKGGALRSGRLLGEIEEYFAEGLSPGDTFVFAGEVLRFEGLVEDRVVVTRASGRDPMIPSYAGGKFPLSTHLARRVRAMLATPADWKTLPEQVAEWLRFQAEKSGLPAESDLLIESFPRAGRYYLVAYPFEGRLAHQTLGMLLTRRLERAGLKPLGFVANDYAIAVWMLADPQLRIAREPGFLATLWDADMLGDDLEDWLAESALMKRSFRNCAIIAGMIERRFPGMEKKARAVTISTDLIYDVLLRHEPDHILLKAARADAATGLMDLRRLSDLLMRIRGRIRHRALACVSPLAVPILLEIGREPVYGEAGDAMIAEEAERLMREAEGKGADF